MTTMTHEKYNELQKKMDKLAGDYVELMAEIESNEDLDMTSEWLDEQMHNISDGQTQMMKKFLLNYTLTITT